MYYTHCAEQSVISIAMLQPTYVTKRFLYYTYDLSLWWRVFRKFLIFSFRSEKKFCFKIREINKQAQMK